MSPLVHHPEANEEILDAVEWYRDESRDRTAGDRFLVAVNGAIDRVARTGTSYLAKYPGTSARYTKLAKFPYLVVFHETGERLLVVAVAHERRRPAYWRDRLDG